MRTSKKECSCGFETRCGCLMPAWHRACICPVGFCVFILFLSLEFDFTPQQFLLGLLRKLYCTHTNDNNKTTADFQHLMVFICSVFEWRHPLADSKTPRWVFFPFVKSCNVQRTKQIAELYFLNIKRHTSSYNFIFFLKLYYCDSIRFVCFFSIAASKYKILCFCFVVLFDKFTATLVQLWKLSGRVVAYGKFAWFLTGYVWKLFII